MMEPRIKYAQTTDGADGSFVAFQVGEGSTT